MCGGIVLTSLIIKVCKFPLTFFGLAEGVFKDGQVAVTAMEIFRA